MAFVENYLIPFIEILVIGGIGIFLAIVVFRALLIRWNRSWKFVVRYDIMRGKVDPVKSAWIIEALQKGISYNQIHQKLLLKGFSEEDVREMLFLCDRFSEQFFDKVQKGGINGRKQFKRGNSKDESKLPSISSY
jgi:hypothetical protein